MSTQVVVFCKTSGSDDEPTVELFDGEIEYNGEYPETIHRVEKTGWQCYVRRAFWLPRKDGVYAQINVFIRESDVESFSDVLLLNALFDTFDSEANI